MVRLVVSISVVLGLLTACSSIPYAVKNDPRTHESQEQAFVNGSEDNSVYLDDDLVQLDEGKHHPAVQVLLTQAEESRQLGKMTQAIAYLDQARQIQPRNPAIFYRQAWLNFNLGNMSRAQQFLQRAKLYMNQDKLLQRRVISLQQDIEAKKGY